MEMRILAMVVVVGCMVERLKIWKSRNCSIETLGRFLY